MIGRKRKVGYGRILVISCEEHVERLVDRCYSDATVRFADNLDTALEGLREARPDVIFADAGNLQMNAVELGEVLDFPASKIVLLGHSAEAVPPNPGAPTGVATSPLNVAELEMLRIARLRYARGEAVTYPGETLPI